jgi:pseudaminic acid cytidylyltransferase
MNNVAIITARGGSKRIPGKNIRPFLGKPIIAYSIEAAIGSGLFSEVMVSTDDKEIAAIAEQYGAKVPFLRSAENSDDFSTTADVLIEVLGDYARQGKQFTYACCIYPTAPFVTAEKLQTAYRKLTEQDADSVIPITAFSFPIWRSFKLEGDKISYNWEEFAPKRSQDLPKAYHDCGQFYFFHTERFLTGKKLVTANTLGIEVPETEVQDIDTPEDWKIAEIKYASLKKDA